MIWVVVLLSLHTHKQITTQSYGAGPVNREKCERAATKLNSGVLDGAVWECKSK